MSPREIGNSQKISALEGIGERLREIRGSASIDSFSRKLGVAKNTLLRYEKEESYADAKFIFSLMNQFGIDPNWFLTGKEPPLDVRLLAEIFELMDRLEGEEGKTWPPKRRAEMVAYVYRQARINPAFRASLKEEARAIVRLMEG